MILGPNGQPIGKTLNQREAVELMAAEVQAREGQPMPLALAPLTAIQLAGLLQLALRHPDLSAELRMTAWVLIEEVRDYFADAPTVQLVLDAGDDPTQDVTPEGDPFIGSDLGACCVCEAPTGARNVLMLHAKAPIAGHGWGCAVCGLPSDGATAVVCDACLGQELKFACRGYPKDEGRIPIAELTGTHEHDFARHRDDLP